MSWFLSVISKQPFLEWEVEKLLKSHPHTENTIVKQSFYFAFDCRDELLYLKKPTRDDPNLKIVMGRGYLCKNTGFSQADKSDWEKLFNREFSPKDIDGHYLSLKVREDFVQVTNDLYGHYPIYFAKAEDYYIISNRQDILAPLLDTRNWDYASLSALALLQMPIDRQPLLKNISQLPPGATITLKDYKYFLTTSTNTTIDTGNVLSLQDKEQYFFYLKKAFELQLDTHDFMSIPFECSYTSQFAFSVWCHKAKKSWGLYHLANSPYQPEDYLDPYTLSSLKIFSIPDFNTPEVFSLYRDYILTTGLSDFTEIFTLAGNFKAEKGIHEINIITTGADWLFEKDPTKRVEKLYNIIKSGSYSDFKKNYIADNEYFEKGFYALLTKGIELHFAKLCGKENVDTENRSPIVFQPYTNIYDFYRRSFQMTCLTTPLAWLNDFRTFYNPALLNSIASMHIAQRHKDPLIGTASTALAQTLADESLDYPIIKEPKWIVPEYPNLNQHFYPVIADNIKEMILAAADCPYYDITKLQKIYNKAQKNNPKAINSILKWTAFEIWRKYID